MRIRPAIALTFATLVLGGCFADNVQHDTAKATALASHLLGNILSGSQPGSSYAITTASFQQTTSKADFVRFAKQLQSLGTAKAVQLTGYQSHGSEAALSVFAHEALPKGEMFYQLVFNGSKDRPYRLSALNVSETPQDKNRLYQDLPKPISVTLAKPATQAGVSAVMITGSESTPKP